MYLFYFVVVVKLHIKSLKLNPFHLRLLFTKYYVIKFDLYYCVSFKIIVSRYFLVSSLISSVDSLLFISILFSLQVFVFFTVFPPPIVDM